jgi:hypothetical protein
MECRTVVGKRSYDLVTVRPFTFKRADVAGLCRRVHCPGYGVVVEKPNQHLLTASWPDEGPTPYSEYAVNGSFAEEVAVYLGFAWRLTEGLRRWAIPAFYHEPAVRRLGRGCIYVDWEYDVDAQATTPETRDRGFVPARASVFVRPEPTAYQRAHRAHAGLFALEDFSDLVNLVLATLADASAEVTVFGLADADGIDRLTAGLRGDTRPELSELLEGGDRFVDITISSDLGYYDSLIVASKEDIGEEVSALAARYQRAVERYESRVEQTTTLDAIRAELARLVAGEGPDLRPA